MDDFVELNPDEARELIAKEKKLLILDNRDLDSYKQGHIDGAMMAHEGLIENLLTKADKSVPILVYCYQGGSSRDVARTFCACGFLQVYSMMGGYASWKHTYGG